MFKTYSLGIEEVSLEDFSDFKATPSNFELIDIQNETASVGKPGLTFLDAPGYFIYKLIIPVNTQAAYDRRLTGFRVEVFSKDPSQRNPLRVDVGRHAAQSRSVFSSLAQFAESTEEAAIASATCPIDVALPNDRIATSSAALQAFVPPTVTSVAFSEPLETSNGRFMTPITYSPPVVSSRSNPSNYLSAVPSNASSIDARTSLSVRGLDPASIVSSISSNATLNLMNSGLKLDSSAFNPAFNSYFTNRPSIPANSISLAPSFYSLRDARQRMMMEITQSESLNSSNGVSIASIISNLDPNQLNGSNQGINAIAGYIANVESRVKNYEYVLRIPKEKLASNQYVYFTITPTVRDENSRGVVAKSSNHAVAHKPQLLELLTPVIKPKIERKLDKSNEVSFEVKQMDPAADKLKITRRIVDPTLMDDGHQSFASYDLLYNQKIVISDLEPQNMYPKNVIYRAIAGYEDKDGPFASITFEGKYPNLGSYESDVSIQATNTREGIRLEVEKFPPEAIAVSINRVDESIVANYKNKTSKIINENNENLFFINRSSRIEIVDRNVANNYVYRYFCTFHFPFGKTSASVQDVIIKRKSAFVQNDPFDIDIEGGNLLVEDNGTISYTANIAFESKPNTFDFIKSLFESQKATDEFRQFIGENRDRISDLIVFKVRRVDRTNGQRHEMGLVKAGEFRDYDRQSRNLRIPPLKRGHSYTYVFTLCLLKPSSILFDIFSKSSSGKIPGQNDVVFNPLLFNERTIRESGALPSNYDLSSPVDFRKAISDSETSMNYRIDVSIPRLRANVEDFRLSSNARNTVLYWRLEGGNVSEVDHCIIKVNTNGNENVLSASVSSGANGVMTAVDDKYHNALGSRSYNITVVYTDGSESTPVFSETLTRRSNANDQLLASMLEREDIKINGSDLLQSRNLNSVSVPTASISRFIGNNQ